MGIIMNVNIMLKVALVFYLREVGNSQMPSLGILSDVGSLKLWIISVKFYVVRLVWVVLNNLIRPEKNLKHYLKTVVVFCFCFDSSLS